MRFIYPTTLPGYFDSKKIAKDKWLQQLASPSSARAGLMVNLSTTDNGFHDTKLITLQKLLTALQ